MAYVSRLADVVVGGITAADYQEGIAVKLAPAGTAHPDLPTLTTATAGEVTNVYVLMASPDDFPRPTPAGLYTAPDLARFPRNSTYRDPIRPQEALYEQGMSTLWNPTLPSGVRAIALRGGTVAVPSGAYINSANILVKGNKVKVGANGRWEYTASETDAVGIVEEFNTLNAVLIFTIKQ